jgi:hypothetical protein
MLILKLILYVLATHTLFLGGGVCIFIRKDVNYIPLDISENCDEKIIELCAVHVNTKYSHLIIILNYGSPSGNFDQFLALLESTLKDIHRSRIEVLICGAIIANYLMHSYRKKQLFHK